MRTMLLVTQVNLVCPPRATQAKSGELMGESRGTAGLCEVNWFEGCYNR
jgi:hypothetical protein